MSEDKPSIDTTDDAAEKTDRGESSAPRARREVKVVPVILVVLLLISGGAATWLYFKEYRPDKQTDAGVASAVVNAASDGTVALLSYSPDTLDKDFAAAKSHLSGDFLSYYNQFTEQIVAPAAKQKSLKTNARVLGAAVQELHPDSAVVLVLVDQSTTSKDNPDPSMASSSVLVSLSRVNGNWLITKFDPV
jgi:Mce-associated membrane protein